MLTAELMNRLAKAVKLNTLPGFLEAMENEMAYDCVERWIALAEAHTPEWDVPDQSMVPK